MDWRENYNRCPVFVSSTSSLPSCHYLCFPSFLLCKLILASSYTPLISLILSSICFLPPFLFYPPACGVFLSASKDSSYCGRCCPVGTIPLHKTPHTGPGGGGARRDTRSTGTLMGPNRKSRSCGRLRRDVVYYTTVQKSTWDYCVSLLQLLQNVYKSMEKIENHFDFFLFLQYFLEYLDLSVTSMFNIANKGFYLLEQWKF